ncbi:hypothetical protein CY34DRAFT_345622 [Suillus luteus UH-Slu-Lm8-n1]|uniref:Uncharacterized protein n=1 Tax=Suillus luteus UH-Slu-Lm8-n1 TaxID=930992 RepID=A0A0D0BVC6_9AGAM|nr:hypothetical protein CY34DRAFT_345622 [Suillus luteus UH-Slu-Lm8-n1]
MAVVYLLRCHDEKYKMAWCMLFRYEAKHAIRRDQSLIFAGMYIQNCRQERQASRVNPTLGRS